MMTSVSDLNITVLDAENQYTQKKLNSIIQQLSFDNSIRGFSDEERQLVFVVAIREFLKCHLFLEDLSNISTQLKTDANSELENVIEAASGLSKDVRNLAALEDSTLDARLEELFSYFKQHVGLLSNVAAPFNELSYFEKDVDESKYIDENGKLNPPTFHELREKISANYGDHKPLVTDMDGKAIIDFPMPIEKFKGILDSLGYPTQRKDLSFEQAKVTLFTIIQKFMTGSLYFEEFCAMLEMLSTYFHVNKSEDKINGYSLSTITLDAFDMAIDIRKLNEKFRSPGWFMENIFEYKKQYSSLINKKIAE